MSDPWRVAGPAADLGLAALGVHASPLAITSGRDQVLAVARPPVLDPVLGEERGASVLLIDRGVVRSS